MEPTSLDHAEYETLQRLKAKGWIPDLRTGSSADWINAMRTMVEHGLLALPADK